GVVGPGGGDVAFEIAEVNFEGGVSFGFRGDFEEAVANKFFAELLRADGLDLRGAAFVGSGADVDGTERWFGVASEVIASAPGEEEGDQEEGKAKTESRKADHGETDSESDGRLRAADSSSTWASFWRASSALGDWGEMV